MCVDYDIKLLDDTYRYQDFDMNKYRIEDFDFAKEGYQKGIHTVRWGSNVDSQVAGHGIIAACELYKITNNLLN